MGADYTSGRVFVNWAVADLAALAAPFGFATAPPLCGAENLSRQAGMSRRPERKALDAALWVLVSRIPVTENHCAIRGGMH
ncbi:MAG: hypothetical protein E5W57_16150 [Mesorhizobium sp.]|nr:MAG: hypothetical protein E5W57_16150 [Mesorhizobium sp.]